MPAPTQGYTARARDGRTRDASDYDHLSRFGEWDMTDDLCARGSGMTDTPARADRGGAILRNTWLSANAGSGKTRVLTDRVARLLAGGVEPQHILCLTYTKAAASEMQNRLFKRLGEWAMMPDDALRRTLPIWANDLPAHRLSRARQLFARAIETPGGLRIQTIHSFCASLLRRFPLEAGVPPGFTEMDDRAAKLMRAEIVEEMADGPSAAVVRRLTEVQNRRGFRQAGRTDRRHRAGFSDPLDRRRNVALFGLPCRVQRWATSWRSVFFGRRGVWMSGVVSILAGGSKTMPRPPKRCGRWTLLTPNSSTLRYWKMPFCKGGSADPSKHFAAKIGELSNQDTRQKLGDLIDPLNNLMARVEAARAKRLALSAAEKTLALHDFAAVFLPIYAARKAARG
jgi:ATP-dependent helicase/nuclease subunit A